MIRRPPRSTPKPSSAASDVYKRQGWFYFDSISTEQILSSWVDGSRNRTLRFIGSNHPTKARGLYLNINGTHEPSLQFSSAAATAPKTVVVNSYRKENTLGVTQTFLYMPQSASSVLRIRAVVTKDSNEELPAVFVYSGEEKQGTIETNSTIQERQNKAQDLDTS